MSYITNYPTKTRNGLSPLLAFRGGIYMHPLGGFSVFSAAFNFTF